MGDETFIAKKGDSVFGTRVVPNAFAKINEGIAKLVMAFQPASKMEAHFKAVGEVVYAKLSDEEKHKIRQNNGFKVVATALQHEKI